MLKLIYLIKFSFKFNESGQSINQFRTIRDNNQQNGITILISEQYARPIFPIVHYGYVLENGGAVLEGTSQELMDNPDVKSAYFGL